MNERDDTLAGIPKWLWVILSGLILFYLTNYIKTNQQAEAERENQKYQMVLDKYSDLATNIQDLNKKFSEFLSSDSKWKLDMMIKSEDRWTTTDQRIYAKEVSEELRTMQDEQRKLERDQDSRIDQLKREIELLKLQHKNE